MWHFREQYLEHTSILSIGGASVLKGKKTKPNHSKKRKKNKEHVHDKGSKANIETSCKNIHMINRFHSTFDCQF